MIPDLPDHPEPVWQDCAERGDFAPIFFDWHGWVGSLATIISFIQPDSLAFRVSEKRSYYLAVGQLARCSKLMLAISALTHEDKFGDAAGIILRSLAESAVKLIWLCQSDTPNRAAQMIADGLRADLELKREILQRVEANAGNKSPLEARMLKSIERCMLEAEMSDSDILSYKKAPDFASMIHGIGWDRLQYVVLQRMSSHAVHGTWTGLLTDYLTASPVEGFRFGPRGDPVRPHANQYMTGARLVLDACKSYVSVFLDHEAGSEISALCTEAHSMLLADYRRASELDL